MQKKKKSFIKKTILIPFICLFSVMFVCVCAWFGNTVCKIGKIKRWEWKEIKWYTQLSFCSLHLQVDIFLVWASFETDAF